MSCTTREDLINSVKNYKAMFKLSEDDTVQDILDRLDFLQKSFIKDVTGYKIEGSDVGVSKSVTQQAQKVGGRKPFTPSSDKADVYNQQADIGNFAHDVWEEMMTEILGMVLLKVVE